MDNRDEIRIMLMNGIEADDVAKELGIARPVVYRVADGILAEQRAERNAQIVAAYKECWPIKVICEKFEISSATMYVILNKAEVPRRGGPSVRVDGCDDLIVKLYVQGATLKVIREWTGASGDYIYKILKREDISLRRPKVNADVKAYNIEDLHIKPSLPRPSGTLRPVPATPINDDPQFTPDDTQTL